MSWKLTMNDITEYKAAYTLFDEDNDGLITTNATKKLIRSLGQHFSEKELDDIVAPFHKQNKGVELHEFLDLMAKYRKAENENDKLLKAFKYFDHLDNGKINFKELSHTLSTLNEKLDENQIKLLEDYCIVNSKNEFDYADLLNLIVGDKGNY